MPTTNAPAAPQTKSRKGGRLPSRLLLCGTAVMILLAQATPSSGQSDRNTKGSTAMTMKDDLTHREKDIHWPQGFDPSKADLFSHNSLLIHASCEEIWSHIVDATTWPSWYLAAYYGEPGLFHSNQGQRCCSCSCQDRFRAQRCPSLFSS
jgi:hypothetical protein